MFTTPAETLLEVESARLVGGILPAEDSVVVTTGPSHGHLTLASDGAFSYEPEAGFVGSDAFTVAVVRDGQQVPFKTVVIRVLPVQEPPGSQPAVAEPPSSVDSFSVGTSTGDDAQASVAFGTLGPLEFAFVWLIPTLVVTLPGLLVVLAVLAQGIAGTVWLPVIRREIGEFGIRHRSPQKPAQS